MATRRYRAWRFVHPDLETTHAVAGASPGLQLSPQGNIEMVGGGESIRQAILLLLSTTPGERVMRPDYGCHLNRLVFSPNDETTAGLANHYVRRALTAWEPRIEIIHLDAVQSTEAPEVLDIHLEYRVRATQQTSAILFSVDLSGDES